jgi:hypothetical protein
MWALLAEKAFMSTGNRIASMKKRVTASMTAEQISEAEQKAATLAATSHEAPGLKCT